MSVQFYVYELRDQERDEPRRVSWNGWREVKDWLNEEGLDADGRMARLFEYRQINQVAEETAASVPLSLGLERATNKTSW